MREDTTRDEGSEEPTRAGGDDINFELESPAAGEGAAGGDQLPAPRKGFLAKIFRRRGPYPSAQAGFVELMGVMHSIKNNLELQSNAQSRLLEALEHFPEAVDSLKHLGKVGENQEQMLGLVRKQVEDSAEHGRQVVDSINRFDHTLNRMDETSRSTAQTMVGVAERSRESEDVLRRMLERSERRLTYLLGAMGILCILVIGGVLFLSVGGGLNPQALGEKPSAAPSGAAMDTAPAAAAPEGAAMAGPAAPAERTGEDAVIVVPLDAEPGTGGAEAFADPTEE